MSFSEGFHRLDVSTVGAGVVEADRGGPEAAGAVAVLAVVLHTLNTDESEV